MITTCETKPVAKCEDTVNATPERAEVRRTYLPVVDILDGGGEILLLADMPGAAREDVEIELEKNVLKVKARPKAEEFAGKTLVYSEYGIGDYERSFTLSEEVDKEAISAELKDGVLRIRLPKTQAVNKRIAVSAG